jgi:hypothetical protein
MSIPTTGGTGKFPPGGFLAEHCRRHAENLAHVRADIRQRQRADSRRYRQLVNESEGPRDAGEIRLFRAELRMVRDALQRVTQSAIDAALESVAAELPAAVRHLNANERIRSNGTLP